LLLLTFIHYHSPFRGLGDFMLEGKNIILGVCGSIAAYKSALLVRLLVKAGAQVQVVMTPDATSFITPLTLSTLSKNPVLVNYFKPDRPNALYILPLPWTLICGCTPLPAKM
jgi:hypothetical protein